jgi:hypothetical protein
MIDNQQQLPPAENQAQLLRKTSPQRLRQSMH